MHDSARKTALAFFDEYGLHGPIDVLEIGAFNFNGSLRESFSNQMRWVGVDLSPGAGVDVVLNDPYVLPFADKEFDVAIATSVFEHDEMFWLSFLEMIRVVRQGGFVYLCSPSNGNIHRYPVDCYRFYPDAGAALAKWARRSGYEITLLESFVLRQDASQWNDWCAVYFIGEKNEAPAISNRLTKKLKPFSIGVGALSSGEQPTEEPTQDQYDLHRLTFKTYRALLTIPVRLFRQVRKWISNSNSFRNSGRNAK
jgi:SAM-dependent methyltransferase